MTKIIPSVERIRELFDFDSVKGNLIRKFNLCGEVLAVGIEVDGIKYPTANIVWLYHYGVWPSKILDHKDRDRYNIKISNLREATYMQNGYNQLKYNSSGYQGIYNCGRPSNPWQAQIRINGVKVNLGRFKTKEEAAKAYRDAALKHHGEFACVD